MFKYLKLIVINFYQNFLLEFIKYNLRMKLILLIGIKFNVKFAVNILTEKVANPTSEKAENSTSKVVAAIPTSEKVAIIPTSKEVATILTFEETAVSVFKEIANTIFKKATNIFKEADIKKIFFF